MFKLDIYLFEGLWCSIFFSFVDIPFVYSAKIPRGRFGVGDKYLFQAFLKILKILAMAAS